MLLYRGWWERAPLALSSNVEVAWNECYDHMRMLDDGGGIYTDSPMPGTIIHHNYIHDEANATVNPWRKAGGGAFYHDGGSTGIRNYMNVVRNPHNNRSDLLSSYTSKWQIHNVTVDHLYSDCLDKHCFGTWGCGSVEHDCPVTNLIAVNESNISNWPAPARAVIEGAGVRGGWGAAAAARSAASAVAARDE